MTCGCVTLASTGQSQAVDCLRNDPRSVEVVPFVDSDIDKPTSPDDSVPVRLLLETPNIRLFEIGVDEEYGYANYGWTETNAGSWGAGGDASHHQAGAKSLWITLSGTEAVSLRTDGDWLIVSIDGNETPIGPADEIEFLHVHGDGNTIDLTRLEKETLSVNLLVDLNAGTKADTTIDSVCGHVVVCGKATDLLKTTNITWDAFPDTPTASTDILEADRCDGLELTELSDALFCDVAFIQSADLGGADQDDSASAPCDPIDLDEDGRMESWNRVSLRNRSTLRAQRS